ncbi:MAG: RICIN domain-containing protein [Acidobacteriaceae bacterium]|nr:RICIN domain-containing protein [Acidobacteriaceae bacterium]
MMLVLKRSAQQEAALQQVLREQQDASSLNYHHWLTPDEFGQRFGLSDQDLQTVTSWLEAQGFHVDQISRGRTTLQFSGTAAQVARAFHTAIHTFLVNGQQHWANASDPQIPAALAPAVAGIATLHNFVSKPQVSVSAEPITAKLKPGSPSPQFTSGGWHALAPADFATIYNVNPVYGAGINGTGEVIAIVGRSNINVQDVISFRNIFGLGNNGPIVVLNGPDPGDLGGGEELEAVLDTSWAGAVAPAAQVDLVVSASTNTTDGVILSEEYIINNSLANVMSESFSDCEANYTASEAAGLSALAQQAAAQGITYIVAAGDTGSANCDSFSEETATGPLSVNILASTPYTIAVGGTQFYDTTNYSQYWNSQAGSNYASALSYIPEDVWNANCSGSSCGSMDIFAGGGGRSQFFSKPSWQTGVPGIPNDGARDVPDVSLNAAGHTPYLLCIRGSCSPNNGQISFSGVYGTSASAPAFAGIMTLVNQKTGSRQGQADSVLYALAAAENFSGCDASNGFPASTCIFNDVTVGTNAVPGEAGYLTGSENYIAGTGYDLASGLGSVNVANLVNQWNTAQPQGGGLSGWYFLVSVNSGQCLDVRSSPDTDWGQQHGAPIQQYYCSGGLMQQFSFTAVSGGYEITSRISGLQLDVRNMATWDGQTICQWPYWGGPNEIWTVGVGDAAGDIYIQSINSGKVLDVIGISTVAGTLVQQWDYWGGPNQLWRLVKASQ